MFLATVKLPWGVLALTQDEDTSPQTKGGFHVFFFFFFNLYLFIFRERGREGEREGEKHQCVVASRTPPTGDLAHNPGMCPDGNRTDDPLVCRLALNPLSHTSQGSEVPSNRLL